jgi:hypothetical protein
MIIGIKKKVMIGRKKTMSPYHHLLCSKKRGEFATKQGKKTQQ